MFHRLASEDWAVDPLALMTYTQASSPSSPSNAWLPWLMRCHLPHTKNSGLGRGETLVTVTVSHTITTPVGSDGCLGMPCSRRHGAKRDGDTGDVVVLASWSMPRLRHGTWGI